MRLLGVFSHADLAFRYGDQVIVRTPRGQEVGVVRCEAEPEITAKLDKGFVEDRIVRAMTKTDEADRQKLQQRERGHLERCKRIIQEMEVVMDLVRVEHIFGGERIILYYTAEGRVDFRELVKVLTAELQTRIEMRQVSIREGLRLYPCLGDCGREPCCCSFLRDTPTVTIKMAKLQRVTLDPAKISGHCGRLKCCLRYEHDNYVRQPSEPQPERSS